MSRLRYAYNDEAVSKVDLSVIAGVAKRRPAIPSTFGLPSSFPFLINAFIGNSQ
jgi:hypothetical protein